MDVSQIQVGMRVVPVGKTIMGSIRDSNVWKRACSDNQPYLYVTKVYRNHVVHNRTHDIVIVCDHALKDYASGDYFAAADLEPWMPYEDNESAIELLRTEGR